MTLIMNLQNFQKKSSMLLMVRITKKIVKEMKMIQALNITQKLLNQFFVIIQMHVSL